MKNRIIYIAMAMALLLPILAGSGTGTGSAWAQTGGSISGHIDNGTSPIISWVQVFQAGPGNSWILRGYVMADGNGNYIFTGLPTGQYHVLAQAYGYANEWYNNAQDQIHLTLVEVTAPNNTPNINFSLVPGGAISGHVQTASTSAPIGGAVICVWEYGKQTGASNFCGLISTNANGNYTTPGLPAGDYAVQVKAAGYATKWYSDTYNPLEAMSVHVDVGATTPGINFSLAPGASISGHIQDAETGTGIEGIGIYVFDEDLVSLLPDKFPAYDNVWTDQNGDYVVSGLAAGEYRVAAVAANGSIGYSGQRLDGISVAPPVNVSNIDFSLECGGYISGYVYQPDNITPVERAQINIYEYDSGAWVYRTHTYTYYTYMDGYYETPGLSAREYKVQVVADGYATEWYDNAYNEAEATLVEVACLNNTSGIDYILSPYQVTWLPPLSTQEVYAAQAGSTVPIKFQVADAEGNPVSGTSIMVTIVRDSNGATVLSDYAVYEPDIPGYRINAKTKGWSLGDYTICLSISEDTKYGMSVVEKGKAK